jgi:chlorite dismutase
MSTGRPAPPPQFPISLEPTEGWHCSHFYYRFDRGVLAGISPEKLQAGREAARDASAWIRSSFVAAI